MEGVGERLGEREAHRRIDPFELPAIEEVWSTIRGTSEDLRPVVDAVFL